MVLDTATTAFLDGMRAAGGKPLHEQAVADVRAGISMVSQQLGVPPADIAQVSDRRIGTGDAAFGIRIYDPRASATGPALPMFLYFHGGGFVAGDVDSHDGIARYYAKHANAIVINVDYRLAPEHRFPAAVDDAFAAVTWAVEHARELNGDAARVAVGGDSAGGTLAAVVCQLAKARGGPSIACQVLVYPLVDARLPSPYPSQTQFGGGQYFLSTLDMQWFSDLYLRDVPREVSDARVSPILATDLSGLPPAIIVTAGCDPLCDQGKAYADRLAAAGASVEYKCFENTIHAFMSFAGAIPVGLEGLSFVASQLQKTLRGA